MRVVREQSVGERQARADVRTRARTHTGDDTARDAAGKSIGNLGGGVHRKHQRGRPIAHRKILRAPQPGWRWYNWLWQGGEVGPDPDRSKQAC
jgi:hypothetical protein